MKIIHTSDWHIGKILNDYSLLHDQRFYLSHFIEDMRVQKPDVIIIAGDIYHRFIPSSDAVELLNDTLETLVNELKIKIIMLSGNHDSKERLSFGTKILEKNGLYICGKITKKIQKITLTDEFGAVNFYAIPYCDEYDVKPLYPEEKITNQEKAYLFLCKDMLSEVNYDERNVFVGHGFFIGGEHTQFDEDTKVGPGEAISLSPFANFDYIALGHIHSARRAGYPHAWYSGSMLKYSVDESAHKKIYMQIELKEKGSISIEKKQGKILRDVLRLRGTFDEIFNAPKCDDYCFVELLDTVVVMDAVFRLKAVYPNILGVNFVHFTTKEFLHTTQNQKIKTQSVEEAFSDFYKNLTEVDFTEYQEEVITQIMKEIKGGGL